MCADLTEISLKLELLDTLVSVIEDNIFELDTSYKENYIAVNMVQILDNEIKATMKLTDELQKKYS